MIPIRAARFPQDSMALKAVIREYVSWLEMDLSYRYFDKEMADFDQLFTLPSGIFFMAQAGAEIAGCAGLLRHSDAVAEVKRLYVRPGFRGRALGEQLMWSVIDQARALGLRELILDAVAQTRVAQLLYQKMGFRETGPYYLNPVAGTRFFSMALLPLAPGEAAYGLEARLNRT